MAHLESNSPARSLRTLYAVLSTQPRRPIIRGTNRRHNSQPADRKSYS